MNSIEYNDEIETYELNVEGNYVFNIHPKKALKLYFFPPRIFDS